MTTITYVRGELAADSRAVGRKTGKVNDGRQKLYPIRNLTFNGVKVLWYGCAGTSSQIRTLRNVLNTPTLALELEQVLSPYLYSIAPLKLSALFLLENGKCVILRSNALTDGTTKITLTEFKGSYISIGTGAKYAELAYHALGIRNPADIVKVACRLDPKTGGDVWHVNTGRVNSNTQTTLSSKVKAQIESKLKVLLED